MGGNLMRTVTFADEKLVARINEHFVPMWHNQDPNDNNGYARIARAAQPAPAQIAAYPVGGGGGNIRAYFAAADGKVFHYLQGYWPAKEFGAELSLALKRVPSVNAKALGVQVHNELDREIANLKKDRAELIRKHPEEFKKSVRESAVRRKHASMGLRMQAYAEGKRIAARPLGSVLKELTRVNLMRGAII